ncbi:7tm Odorant receptor [Popillia japonica]|uniref:7tm Odorant receptor n=1 Tax=Popillia japonica TaxID=7064 RepID=A0AAW1L799_POPJA
MSRLMLIDFAVASMQMATLGLQMIVSGVGWQQMFALEFLIAMLIQLFLFYWHANEIMLQSVEVAKAIWESDWFEYSEDIKKSLVLVILRCQKPLTLSVGPGLNTAKISKSLWY